MLDIPLPSMLFILQAHSNKVNKGILTQIRKKEGLIFGHFQPDFLNGMTDVLVE